MAKYIFLSSFLFEFDIEEVLENKSNLSEDNLIKISENIRVAQNLQNLFNYEFINEEEINLIEDVEKMSINFHVNFNDFLIPFFETEFFNKPIDTKPKIEYLIMKLDNLISTIKEISESINNTDVKIVLIEFTHNLITLTHQLYSFTPGFIYNYKWVPEDWNRFDWRYNNKISTRSLKKAKQLWSLPTRYKLFEELELLKIVRKFETRNDQNFILSQILGINIDNAKKLINGTYIGKTQDTDDLECLQLIEKYLSMKK